VNSNNKKS